MRNAIKSKEGVAMHLFSRRYIGSVVRLPAYSIYNRHSKLPEFVHKKDVHVHKERKQLICRVEVEANFSMVCT